ncbi:hypothetical protein [Roseomonas sp. 18066]|uniref:AAA family ATPase n=1 Tax=Roseomonas sp. 18066 TaxID=2681412 RepID=UPI00135A1D43|nr:hypothetical protein [Roseomonas sp. 18066]
MVEAVAQASDTLPVVAVMSADAALIERLEAALAGLAVIVRAEPEGEAGLALVEAIRPGLVACDLGAAAVAEGAALDAQGYRPRQRQAAPDFIGRLGQLRRLLPQSILVALGDETAPEQVLEAVRAGAQDVLDRQTSVPGLQAALRPRLEAAPRGAQRGGQAECLALLAARPEDGAREIAMALACARADRGKREVLLLDLAPGAGAVEVAFDLALQYGVGDALRDIERLDAALLRSAVPRERRSGLATLLLRAPEDLDGVTLADLRALLLVLRGVYAEVVLHLGSVADPLRLALATGLGRFGLVMTQEVASAAAAAALLRRLDQPGLPRRDRVVAIVARHQPAILLPAQRLVEELELGAPVLVAESRVAEANAANAGDFAGHVIRDRGMAAMAAALAPRLGAPAAAPPARRFALPWGRRA